MFTEAFIGVLTDQVFSNLIESYGASDKVRDWLKRDPQKLAFESALMRTCTRFAQHDQHKVWAESFFDEHFLQNRAAPVLAECLTRDGQSDGVQLAEAWANQFRLRSTKREEFVAQLTPAASDFLNWLNEELRKQAEFQPLFDSRAQDLTADAMLEASIAMIEMAEASRETVVEIRALREEAAQERTLFMGLITRLMLPEHRQPPQITITNPSQNQPILSPPQEISEDGQLVAQNEPITEPLQAFKLEGFLSQLDAPGGGVRLRDKLYIERGADAELRGQLLKWGSTTTIHAPRQTGKTSLLVRGLHYAKKEGAKVVLLHFESLSKQQLSESDLFLRTLADIICRNLRLNRDKVRQAWQVSGNAQQKLTYFLEDHVLPAFDVPIILAMDHADSLLQTDFHKNFFGLVRSWHDRRAFDPELWEKLNIVLSISTEPYLLINEINQSPFNVGLKIELDDFNTDQVKQLNKQHRSPINLRDFADFLALFAGQPYLTRQAFYTLLAKKVSWRDLVNQATSDDGPFGAHLRDIYSQMSNDTELKRTLKQIIQKNSCSDDRSCFRLLRAGLIKPSGKGYTCRCDLYRRYFERKLS